MADLPQPVQRLDARLLAATIAHEYVADRCRELVELDADDDRSRRLLAESAAIILERMPRLAAPLRRLAREWAEQDVLDPQRPEQTLADLSASLARIEPCLGDLRERQREIASELSELVRAARKA
jgi:hypothetical protein